MLFTANETAYILDIQPAHVYYMFNMSKTDGAIKVLNCWRIDEASLRELYERIYAERTELFADNLESERFEERIETVRQKYVSDCSRPRPSCLQGRSRLECSEVRSNCLDREKRMIQGELWADGDFW